MMKNETTSTSYNRSFVLTRRRLVSFEDDTMKIGDTLKSDPFATHSFKYQSTLLNSDCFTSFTQATTNTSASTSAANANANHDRDNSENNLFCYDNSFLNTENRVVSHETILCGGPDSSSSSSCGLNFAPASPRTPKNYKRSSKSFPSMTRYGDLKSLLEEESNQDEFLSKKRNRSAVPTVSEECLLSFTMSDYEDDEDVDQQQQDDEDVDQQQQHHHHQHNRLDDIQDSHPHHDSSEDDFTATKTLHNNIQSELSTTNTHTPSSSLPPPCTGWGQFVVVEHNQKQHSPSRHDALLCPTRRRRRRHGQYTAATSTATSSSYAARYKPYSNHRMRKQTSSSLSSSTTHMYSTKTTTRDIVEAMRIQLSLNN